LDLVITAAEQKGTGKLLSRPKIVTQNNKQGRISQGVKIPIQTTVNNTVSVTFQDVTLSLQVTPQITSDGYIFMDIDVTNSTIDPGIPRINGTPALDTQEATTSVMVPDGGTVMFGGVVQNSNNLTIQQVPLLGSIPILGNLFKSTSVSTTTTELIFFVTPKVL
jgi:type IV pilus assembly protein PilQ